MTWPRISVITPSLNQGKFIERTIRSVLDQEYPQLEHIVMDGGSTDETLDILAKYDHLIWRSEPDRGQSHAVNKGFALASGAILGWLNADDLYEPGAFFTVAGEFERDPDLGMLYGGFRIIDQHDKTLQMIPGQPFDYNKLRRRSYSYIANQSVFLRRRVVDEVGMLDETLYFVMDHDYWVRVSERAKVSFVEKLLGAFRHHDEAKSQFQQECQAERDILWSRYYRGSRIAGFALKHYWEARSRLHLARMNKRRAILDSPK